MIDVKTVRGAEPLEIVPVHASAVQLDGGAMIFLGPSSAGKSTICRLLSASAKPLADDRVYLVPRGEGWIVADGGDRILEGTLSEQEAAALDGPPLHAILRLHQSDEPQIEAMDAMQCCYHLTNAFFELPWHEHLDTEVKKRAFANLAAIARAVPGYRLRFDRSPRTVEMVAGAIRRSSAARGQS